MKLTSLTETFQYESPPRVISLTIKMEDGEEVHGELSFPMTHRLCNKQFVDGVVHILRGALVEDNEEDGQDD